MGDEVSLKEFLQTQITHERELRTQMAHAYAEALDLAKEAIEYRLEAMNQLRDQINAERGQFATRDSADKLDKRIQLMEQFSANIHGRVWMFVYGTTLLSSSIAIAVTILLQK